MSKRERGARAPMSATVLLARHASHAEVGRVLSGRSEIALTDAGRAEAGRLAARLAGTRLVAIHSSPRRRARETAAIVAERHGLAVAVNDALDEIDFGEWTGRSFASLAGDPRWRTWNAARSGTTPPGGEAMADATERARLYVETLTRALRQPGPVPGFIGRPDPAHEDEAAGPPAAGWTPEQARGDEEGEGSDLPILCVTHCDIIRGLAAHYLGLDPDRLLAFDCDPASLTTLALFPGGGRVVALNERPQ